MIRKNYYKRITESIIKAHHDNNLDSAMEDGHEMENMGKKIVAIITADPDQDIDWESEYEPFGATELTSDDEAECCEHEGIEHDTCPSCGTDVDGHIVSDDEDDDTEENDDMEDIMIGGGFESEDDDMEDMDVKDILVDILHELRGEDGEESEDEGAFETSDENPMFGGSSDDEESDDDFEDDDDAEGILSAKDDWSSEESDDDDDEQEDDYDGEEDFEGFSDEDGIEQENAEQMLAVNPQEQEEDEVEIFDCLDNA
jgi:hypothetical protein